MEQNYYKILGVSNLADQDEIEKSARNQLNKIKKSSQQAYFKRLCAASPSKKIIAKKAIQDRINEIKEAYSVLSDAEKRKAYDEMLETENETTDKKSQIRSENEMIYYCSSSIFCIPKRDRSQ